MPSHPEFLPSDSFLKMCMSCWVSQKTHYCKLHFSTVSMSAIFLLGLVSSRPWQGSRQWEKGRSQGMCLPLYQVESSTMAVLPNLISSSVLPSQADSDPWALVSATSSPSHSDLGAIVVFCFLISESPYRFSVVCLSSFLICVISSLYQAISDYYLRVVFLVGLFTGCEVLEWQYLILHMLSLQLFIVNCLSLLSF